MKKFLSLYLFNSAILFTIYYFNILYISSIQTDLTAYLLSIILPDNLIKSHEIFIDSRYSLIIERACNGLIAYFMLLASIISFSSPIKNKIVWITLGYIIINIINTFRIWLIIKFVLKDKNYFYLAHDIIGNILLILTSLLIFILFIKNRYNSIKKGKL